MRVDGGTLQQLHHQRVGVVHSVGRQLTHLIHVGVADHLVLERHCQHLVVAQRLVERDETPLAIEGIFVAVQQSGTLHLFVVLACRHAESLHVAGHRVDAADGRGVDIGEQVVGIVMGQRRTRPVDTVVGRHALAKVGQCEDIAVLRHRSAHVGAPHLDADDAHI